MKKEEPTEKKGEEMAPTENKDEVNHSDKDIDEKKPNNKNVKKLEPILNEEVKTPLEKRDLKTKRISILEVCGVIIAGLAFFVSIWQTYETRNHNRLSVTPKIVIWVSSNDINKTLDIEIQNTGIGPAVIKEVEVIIDDSKTIKVDDTNLGSFWDEIFNELGMNDIIRQNTYHSIVGEDVFIPANEKLEFLSLIGDNITRDEYLRFKNKLLDLSIKIKYCSVYEDCYENYVDVEEYYEE